MLLVHGCQHDYHKFSQISDWGPKHTHAHQNHTFDELVLMEPTKKNILVLVFAGLTLLVSLCQTAFCLADDNKRPNILFIAIDDLRPAMGSYGDSFAVTPHMDELASTSLQFNRAYCQVAVCNPSRASLMTGMRPDKLGVWTLPIHFREAKPDVVTMPQWFRKFGYTAVSHGKIYHNPTPDPQSWSEPIRELPSLPFPYPDGTKEMVKAAQDELPKNDWRKKNLRRPSTSDPELADTELRDGAQTDMAIEDLRRLGKQDKPFFLAMGYIRPHLAFIAPKKYWDMHDPATLPVLTDQQVNPNTPRYALHNNSELSHYVDLIDIPKPWDDRTLSPEKARRLMHGYYACVSYVDAQIGRLMAALEEEGLADNTIVVLWSDHGWKLGEYRGWGKMTNYEIDARVPLFIRAPGMQTESMPTAGKQTEQVVELLDLFPTLCDLAKIRHARFCRWQEPSSDLGRHECRGTPGGGQSVLSQNKTRRVHGLFDPHANSSHDRVARFCHGRRKSKRAVRSPARQF